MGLELVTGYQGKLHITAPQDADLYRGLIGDGRVKVGNQMGVTITAPLQVTVLDGVCVLDGREFFIANEDSVEVDCPYEDGEVYLCICYEQDNDTRKESADLQILETYNDTDIRDHPGASQKPLARLTVEGGTITDVEMMLEAVDPIMDTGREAAELLEEIQDMSTRVDEDLTTIEGLAETLPISAASAEEAAERANTAAQLAETVCEDALIGVNVNGDPQEIVDHVVNIEIEEGEALKIAEEARALAEEAQSKNTEQDTSIESNSTDITALQTENESLKAQIAELEEEISELNTKMPIEVTPILDTVTISNNTSCYHNGVVYITFVAAKSDGWGSSSTSYTQTDFAQIDAKYVSANPTSVALSSSLSSTDINVLGIYQLNSNNDGKIRIIAFGSSTASVNLYVNGCFYIG